MFVARTVPLDQKNCISMIFANSIEELNLIVKNHLPTWTWKKDKKQLFGGYWVDKTLTKNREGECYQIDIAMNDEVDMFAAAGDYEAVYINKPSSGLRKFYICGCVFGEDHRSMILNEIAHIKTMTEDPILCILDEHIRMLPVPLPYVEFNHKTIKLK